MAQPCNTHTDTLHTQTQTQWHIQTPPTEGRHDVQVYPKHNGNETLECLSGTISWAVGKYCSQKPDSRQHNHSTKTMCRFWLTKQQLSQKQWRKLKEQQSAHTKWKSARCSRREHLFSCCSFKLSLFHSFACFFFIPFLSHCNVHQRLFFFVSIWWQCVNWLFRWSWSVSKRLLSIASSNRLCWTGMPDNTKWNNWFLVYFLVVPSLHSISDHLMPFTVFMVCLYKTLNWESNPATYSHTHTSTQQHVLPLNGMFDDVQWFVQAI